MAEKADLEAIRASTDLVALVRASVALTRRGREYWAPCPLHKDDTASFHVRPEHGNWRCFGCGAGGDVFDWVMQSENVGFAEAVKRLQTGATPKANGHKNGHHAAAVKPKPTPAVIQPVPDEAGAATFDHPRLGLPSATWAYRSAAGALLGHICRFDTPQGKEVLPRVYTAQGWRWQGFPRPRPLYGLDQLAARPDAPVLVCEGEKAADAARTLCPDHVVVTWCGGTAAVEYADWEPLLLQGRAVLIWPDNDPPGEKAAATIKALIPGAKVVHPPEGWPKGHDAADLLAEGWTPERVKDWWIAKKVGEPHVARPPARGPRVETVAVLNDAALEAMSRVDEPDEEQQPFAYLGHRHGTYFYLPRSGGTVISIPGAGHSKNALMMLAPLNWWEITFGCKGREGWDTATNALFQRSHKQGIYDPSRIRGRGAWWDAGRSVIHLGDRLTVDGVPTPLRDMASEYLYEVGPRIKFGDGAPLKAAEAGRLIELCRLLSWERTVSAYLLAGWCAIAPICGALKWRPHIFLTGGAGAGKSWCYENVITRSVGNAGLALASAVSEPGIRRALGSDALPIMIDELEAKDQNGVQRLEGIMGLMRYSSSETDAMIVKGAQGGGGVEWFRIRSMFCTVAIGSQLNDYADTTRNSVLALRAVHGAEGAARFEKIQAAQRELMTDAWIDGLHARIAGMIPTIRHNAEVFAAAGAKVLNTRRLGDQIGTLLAGAHALTSSREITPEAAELWIELQDWTDEREINADTDGPMCLAKIMEHQVSVEATGRGSVKRSLGELVPLARATLYAGDDFIPSNVAIATLKRHGIMPMPDDYVAISNTHSEIAKILYDTPWSSNWGRRLKVIPEARSSKQAMSFGAAGTTAQAVLVKM